MVSGQATPFLKIPFKLAQLPRLAMFPNASEFYRYSTDEVVTKGAPGLAELGVDATPMETVGIRVLRRYRKHIFHDDIVE